MPQIQYIDKRFSQSSLKIISQAERIASDYASQGYDLTLRQLYYQFVARDLIENSQKSYKRLGSIINDARMAGVFDWRYIVDRTRNLRSRSHWNDPEEIISGSASQFHMDLWENQTYRPEVWIEKDALVGVIERPCRQFDVPYFSCRGYSSQSEMWRAGQRLKSYIEEGQVPIIFHLGDHDPSGIDMTRDIQDRLNDFLYQDWINEEMWDQEKKVFRLHEVRENMYDRVVRAEHPQVVEEKELPVQVVRLALNMDQVDQYEPPPNPAKLTDSRARDYISEHGNESWELDALDPPVITALITDAVNNLIDGDEWEDRQAEITEHKEVLASISQNYASVAEFVSTL